MHERILPDGSRAGFFMGDGTGIGKSRMIAGLIAENRQKKRKKAIWISMSSELKNAAQQDLLDIGAGKIKVHSLTGMMYGHKISADGTISGADPSVFLLWILILQSGKRNDAFLDSAIDFILVPDKKREKREPPFFDNYYSTPPL
ncbi:hypothetical protein DAPPUDRAFT_326824 [Daphnia pulex]|uniref:Strawberry notch AAA domain-containing protein n=1 Tax=Daphnia pulex TaxID=6669 RepID=E9H8W1_DAPPU|nr:hypothetical protein DAPPUDRAFT_326824 [Daphnia pulex]|eukprot:EFX71824.1 hypothetical protein DAPPUDRAFT_326824 [Daphnia pulex]